MDEIEFHWDEGCFIISDLVMLDRPFCSARRMPRVPKRFDELVYISDGNLTLPRIAALSEVYNDDRYWFVLQHANDLSPFIAVFQPIERDVELRVPSLAFYKEFMSRLGGA